MAYNREMATSRKLNYTYGDLDEIAFTSRNDMNLAVWESEGMLRLYSYTYEDTFRERVGRFLHNGLTKLWERKQFCDLQVNIGTQVFQCHRAILASVSPYFKRALLSEHDHSKDDVTQMDVLELDEAHVKPEIFQLLLDMIYDGKDVLKEDKAFEIMKAACFLEIKALELNCLETLVKKINERTCMDIWNWAEANNVTGLASKAKGVALSHFQVLRHTEEFLRIPLARLTMMLDHELLTYRYEDDLLGAILDWVTYDSEDREQHLRELLPYVLFPYLSTRYVNQLRKHPLLLKEPQFAQRVDEALTYHLAALQADGKEIQRGVLKRAMLGYKRPLPGMRRVVVLLGGAVVRNQPLSSCVACYLDMGHPHSRQHCVLQFSIASLPRPLGMHFASATCNNDIYVSGGTRTPDTFLVYKNDNTWHSLPDLPSGRMMHGMVCVGTCLYLLGGRASEDEHQPLAQVDEFDTETNTWTTVGDLIHPVEAAPVVTVSNKIYVLGGRSGAGDSVRAIQCLEVREGRVRCRVVGQLPHDTHDSKAIVVGNDIILVCPDGNIFKVSSSESGDSAPGVPAQQLSIILEDVHQDRIPDQTTLNQAAEEKLDTAEDERGILKDRTKEGESLGVHSPAPGAAEDEGDRERASSDDEAPEEEEREEDSAPRHARKEKPTADSVAERTEVKERDREEKEKDDDVEKEQDDDDKDDDEKELDDDDGKERDGKEVDQKDRKRTDKEAGETDEEEEEKKDEDEAESPNISPRASIETTHVANMAPRSDFGLFVRKADVMVVGGEDEEGRFLDDLLRVHVATGRVCSVEGRLAIPLSGMQVQQAQIHQNYLLQFFDAASCFFEE